MEGLSEEDLDWLVRDYYDSQFMPINRPEKTPKSAYLKEILGEFDESEFEIQQAIGKYHKFMKFREDDPEKKNMKKLINVLRLDGFEASICKTSWNSTFDGCEGCQVFRHTGEYEYIDVIINGNRSKKRIIIDLDFKSQFELSRPTKSYQDLTELLPLIFVGTEEKLKKVITLVCSASKKCLKKKGIERPPWRRFSYVQNKWFSMNCLKVSGRDRGFAEAQQEDDLNSNGDDASCCFFIF